MLIPINSWGTSLPPARPRGRIWLMQRMLTTTAPLTVFLWPPHRVLGHELLLGSIWCSTGPKIKLLILDNTGGVLNPSREVLLQHSPGGWRVLLHAQRWGRCCRCWRHGVGWDGLCGRWGGTLPNTGSLVGLAGSSPRESCSQIVLWLWVARPDPWFTRCLLLFRDAGAPSQGLCATSEVTRMIQKQREQCKQ